MIRTTLLPIVLCIAFASQLQAETEKPNIVFLMADDLGAGWVDYDGSNPELNTPNLQRLADSGMVFTKAYAACPVCTPTRAACITRRSPAQIGVTTHIPGNAFRAMVESLVNMVGAVLDALEATGLRDNTMVVFYSDNGGHFPTEWLAGKKTSLLEGGVRVPMVASWPGVIKAGTSCDVPVNSMDFFRPSCTRQAARPLRSINRKAWI